MTDIKAKFEEVLSKCDSVAGFENIRKYFDKCDFYNQPASTIYHSSFKGGLMVHSLNVVNVLLYLTDKLGIKWSRPVTPYVVGVLHDLCKCDFYLEDTKNKKVDGVWKAVPYFTVDDKMPLGHGEKSALMSLMLGVKLTLEEVFCIRWHMGAFEEGKTRDYGRACGKYPNIAYVALADQLSGIAEDNKVFAKGLVESGCEVVLEEDLNA